MKYILLFFCLASTCLTAQTYKVEYVYNASGGRTLRKVVELEDAPVPQTRAIKEVEQDVFDSGLKGQLMTDDVKIYPNPTEGSITIDLRNTLFSNSEQTIAEIALYDASGRLLQTSQIENEIWQLDLTSYMKGWYLLLIRNGVEQQEFKIIKK